MPLSAKLNDSLLHRGFSRRDLGRMASLLTAGATIPLFSEYAMAQDAQQRMLRGTPGARRANDPDTVRISSNENPMGPCKEGLEAIAKVAPHGWRYSPFGEQGDFVTAIAEMEGVKENYVAPYARIERPAASRRLRLHFAHAKLGWRIPAMAAERPSSSAPKPPASRCVRISATTSRP